MTCASEIQKPRIRVRAGRNTSAGFSEAPFSAAMIERAANACGGISAMMASNAADISRAAVISPTMAREVRETVAALLRREVLAVPVLPSHQRVLDYLHVAMSHETREQFRVLFLDRKNRLIADEGMGQGTVDHCPVYPREVVKRALELDATALVLVHNHPSGDPMPSGADIDMTKEIVAACRALGIAVHDHIVIGRSGHASFKARGLI